MKKCDYKRIIAFGLFPIITISLCIGFCMLFLDKALVYSVNTQSTYTAEEFLKNNKKNMSAKYESVYEIPEGIYTIKIINENIYVLNESQEKLYLAKAKISDFSAEDKVILMQGVSAKSNLELFEMIEYMES